MFQFIKLVQPVWYFNLKPSRDHGYFPSREVIERQLPHLKADPNFSAEGSELELSYRAHRLGCIDPEFRPGVSWWDFKPASRIDEYRFLRKYFHISRVLFTLCYRIISFHNPFRELLAFYKTSGTKKFNYEDAVSEIKSYTEFKSTLIQDNPLITVIIPTLNRYLYLKDVLADLEQQDYQNFNVIIVDQSSPYLPDFYKDCKLKLKIIRQEEKALWLARNSAIRNTEADYLLFYDDDSRIENDWISQHLKCIDYFKAAISSGVSVSKIGAAVPGNYRFFRWSDQLDTGNVLIHRDVFKSAGLFDRQFEGQRMGDGEFGLRSYLKGFRNISNPCAKRLHLKVGGGGLREMGSWDAFRPKNLFSLRPVPSVLYLYRKYHGAKAARLSVLFNILPSIIPYKYKNNKPLLLLGSLIAFIMIPIILVQVIRSWKIASSMLKNSTIENL